MDDVSTIVADPSIGQIDYLLGLQKAAPGVLPACMTVEIEVDDPDIASLEKAIAFFVRRHESVRTVFPLIDGAVKQKVLPYTAERFALEQVDIRTRSSLDAAREEYCKKAAAGFLDIQQGPLIRVFLFNQGRGKFTFLLVIHHIICDSWSLKIIRNELIQFYMAYAQGQQPDVQPLTAQLRDYCQQKNAWLTGSREELSRFWKNRLAGYEGLFNIGDYLRGYAARGNKKALDVTEKIVTTQEELFELYNHPAALAYVSIVAGSQFEKIKKMSVSKRCTMASIVYASLYITLYTYTRKNKVLLAALIADRFTPANQQLIGCLLGGVYFPREVSEETTIHDFISSTQDDLFDNWENIIPCHEYIDLDGQKIRAGCDIYINYLQRKETIAQLDYVQGVHQDMPGIYYALDCMIFEHGDGFVFEWKYNKLLFDKEVLADLTRCHAEVLNYMAANSEKTIRELDHFIMPEVARAELQLQYA